MKAILFSLIFSVSLSAHAVETKAPTKVNSLTITSGKTDFYATGKPSMLKIHGEGEAVSGSIAIDKAEWSGKVQVKLKEFKTGMKVRDDHLQEKVFESAKYETAQIKFEKLVVPFENEGSAKDLDFKGSLNFHGVEKVISGKVSVSREAAKATFDAHFDMNLPDFSITPPEFMGMTIQEKVKVDVKGEAK